MAMKMFPVPSLGHLCCMKIMPILFQKVLPLIEVSCLFSSSLFLSESIAPNMDPDSTYTLVYNMITDSIKALTSCTPLQKRLQNLIAPLYCEIEDWMKFCKSMWALNGMLNITKKSIPCCFSPDGSIDRLKSVKILVKNKDFSAAYRFEIACTFCMLDDVLDIWKILTSSAKDYLRHFTDVTVKLWIEWLESNSKKDSQSFIKWASETQLHNNNVYILKHVFKTLNSAEKNQYLINALTKRKVSSDIMCFGLPLLTRDEQEMIFKKSPVEVFKCLISWRMRSSFFDIVDILIPHLTCDTFCDLINMLLLEIKIQKKDYVQLVVILKTFWAESPRLFQDFAISNSSISEPLQIVIDYNLTETFPTQKYLDSFGIDPWLLTPFVI